MDSVVNDDIEYLDLEFTSTAEIDVGETTHEEDNEVMLHRGYNERGPSNLLYR